MSERGATPFLVSLPTLAPDDAVAGRAPGGAARVVPEVLSAHSRAVAGPDAVPRTGDAPVDAALEQLRALLSGPHDAQAQVGVLSAVHDALARRLADAAG